MSFLVVYRRFSLGLDGLNANNINEFFEAIQNAESLGKENKLRKVKCKVTVKFDYSLLLETKNVK